MVDPLNEREKATEGGRKKSELKSSLNLKAIKILFAMIIAADQCLIKRSNCLSNSLILCDYIYSHSRERAFFRVLFLTTFFETLKN